MKTYNPKESAEYFKKSQTSFTKSYETAKRQLKSRIKTFEKHGQGNTAAAQRLRQSLYDISHARSNTAKSKAFSEATQTLNSARGSYSKSLSVDQKIVKSLNERFAQFDEETGEEYGKFIKLSELKEFGEIMEELKNQSFDKLFGSGNMILMVRDIMNESKTKSTNWRTIANEYIKKSEVFKK